MSDKRRGLFVVLEGGEGVGKTTNAAFIRDYLSSKGIEFVASREPGGTPLAEELRETILQPRKEPMAPMAELLLVFAARAQHITQKIEPVIASGRWLLCDRFTDATYAYQGSGRSLGKETVEALENLVQGELRPDCVIVLDAPVEVGQARVRERSVLDRLESESALFHQRVREAYLERAAKSPGRYVVIDAAQPLSDVQQQLSTTLDQLIKQWQGEVLHDG